MRSCLDPFTYGKEARRSLSCQSNVGEHTKVDTGWNHSRRLKKSSAWRGPLSTQLVLPILFVHRGRGGHVPWCCLFALRGAAGSNPGQGPPAHVGVYATWLVPRSTRPSSAYRPIFHRWPRHRDVIDVLLNLFSLCRCPRVPGFLAILTCTQRNDERSYQLLVKIRWYVHIPSPRSSLVASLSLSLLS